MDKGREEVGVGEIRAEPLREYAAAFEAIKEEAAVLAEGVPEDVFNWKPGLERWSMAECYDHLNRVAELMMPYLDAAIERGRREGRTADGPFRYGPVSRWWIASMQPGARRLTNPKLFTPSAPSELSKERVVRRFMELQDAWIERIRRADGLDLRRILVRSSVTPLFRISLGAWFESNVAHERRHLLQARRVKEQQVRR